MAAASVRIFFDQIIYTIYFLSKNYDSSFIYLFMRNSRVIRKWNNIENLFDLKLDTINFN